MTMLSRPPYPYRPLAILLLLVGCADPGDTISVDRSGALPSADRGGAETISGTSHDAAREDTPDASVAALPEPSTRTLDGSAPTSRAPTSDASDGSIDGRIEEDAALHSPPDAQWPAHDASAAVAVEDAAGGGADGASAADAAPPADGAVQEEARWCGRIRCDCVLNGQKLYGRVQVVTALADFEVRETSFPDLNVRKTSLPGACGEWEFVTALPDFTIQWVSAFEDFSIAYSSFPGLAQR